MCPSDLVFLGACPACRDEKIMCFYSAELDFFSNGGSLLFSCRTYEMLAYMKYREEIFRQFARLWLQASNAAVSLQFQARYAMCSTCKTLFSLFPFRWRCRPHPALPSISFFLWYLIQGQYWGRCGGAAKGAAGCRGLPGSVGCVCELEALLARLPSNMLTSSIANTRTQQS